MRFPTNIPRSLFICFLLGGTLFCLPTLFADNLQSRANSEAFRKVLLYQFSKIDSTIFYAKVSADEALKAHDSARYVLMLAVESVAMVDVGKIQEGFAQASSAVKIAEKLTDTLARAFSLYAVGYASGQHIISKTNDSLSNITALTMLRESLVLGRSAGDSLLQMQVLNSIGRVFRKMREWDSAASYHEEARAFASALRVTRAEAWAWHSLSICYEGKKILPLALSCSLEALRLREMVGVDLSTSVSLNQTSKLYSALGKKNEAMLYAEKNIAVSERSQDLAVIVNAWNRLAEVQGEMGKYSEALKSFQRYKKLHDSLRVIEFRTDIRILQKESEFERMQAKNQLLEQQQAQETAIRNRQWIIIWLVIAIALGLSFLSLQLVRTRRKTEEQNRQLHSANETIEQNVAELQSKQQEISTTSELLQTTNDSLQKVVQNLEERDRERTEIMSVLAHDIKNPLASIQMMAQMLDSDADNQELRTRLLPQIHHTAARAMGLAQNLLESNRLETGAKAELEVFAFDPEPLISSMLEQYTEFAKRKNVALLYLNKAEGKPILANEQAMMQVLDNLISNAVKFSPFGKRILVRVQEQLSSSNPRMLRIEVKDEGEGISSTDMKKLFGKFARLSSRPTGGEHSTGLGLSIVKKLVESMNGKVWCESELGFGAKFIVELPQGKR